MILRTSKGNTDAEEVGKDQVRDEIEISVLDLGCTKYYYLPFRVSRGVNYISLTSRCQNEILEYASIFCFLLKILFIFT